MHKINFFRQKSWDPSFAQVSTLFFPIMPYGEVFSKFVNWPSIEKLNSLKPAHVCTFLSQPVCFVEQKGGSRKKNLKSPGLEDLYEPRIFLKGEVSTRLQSWHDFFNALIWYAFPRTKSALNMRQFISYDERASFPWKTALKNRTREQDLMAMFDEGGCILVNVETTDENTQIAKNFKIPFLFGHGFYEMISYGEQDLSACTLEINLKGQILKKPLCDILTSVDEQVSALLLKRDYYKKENAFKSVHLREFHLYLDEFLRAHSFLH